MLEIITLLLCLKLLITSKLAFPPGIQNKQTLVKKPTQGDEEEGIPTKGEKKDDIYLFLCNNYPFHSFISVKHLSELRFISIDQSWKQVAVNKCLFSIAAVQVQACRTES